MDAQFSSVAQSCQTLCDPMDCSKPGFLIDSFSLIYKRTRHPDPKKMVILRQSLPCSRSASSPIKVSSLPQHLSLGFIGLLYGRRASLDLVTPGEGNGNPLQYSCLGNTMDRGVWQGTVHGISKESDMIERSTTSSAVACICKLFESHSPQHVLASSLVAAMWETRVWSLGEEDPLEKETATHSSILVWEIQWTEESGGLQSMGLQRVGHNWEANSFS